MKIRALNYHQKFSGKIATLVLQPIKTKEDLSLAYTPGVAQVCTAIAKHPEQVYKYTQKSRTVAVVTDGSAVLGLGNIGPEAALPVMEGKAALFKTFANLDAVPICLNTQNPKEIVQIVTALAPNFGGINLEDISAPRCFEIESALQSLSIPVMHDDQHGTAVVVLAGLINATKVVNKNLKNLKIVISGAGAAGNAIAQLLSDRVGEILILDSQGLIYSGRQNLDHFKAALSATTNPQKHSGNLKVALKKSDVFIGVSKADLLKSEDIKLMNSQPIIFAMANPNPEIMPDQAKLGGAAVIATGRSDFPNQINNSLAFPGIFKGALTARKTNITQQMKVSAALALASLVKNPTAGKIVPGPFDQGIVEAVATAVANA